MKQMIPVIMVIATTLGACASTGKKRARKLPLKTISQTEMDAAGKGCKESDYMLGHALSPDGTRLFTTSNANGLTWDMVSGKPTRRFKKYQFGLGALKWHDDGKHLLIPHLGTIVIADTVTGITVRELETDTDGLPDAARLTPLELPLPEEDSQEGRVGEQLDSGFGGWQEDTATTSDGTCVSLARPLSDRKHVVGIRCDATGGFFVWDFASGKLINHVPGIRMTSIATVSTSPRVAFGTKSEGILVLDDFKSRVPTQIPVAGETNTVAMCPGKPDLLAYSTSSAVEVIHVPSGATVVSFPARRVAQLEFTTDCKSILAVSGQYPAAYDDANSNLAIYDLARKTKARELELPKAVGVTLMPTQEEVLVTFRDGTIRVLSIADWSVKRELRHPLAKDKPTECRIDD